MDSNKFQFYSLDRQHSRLLKKGRVGGTFRMRIARKMIFYLTYKLFLKQNNFFFMKHEERQ